MSDIAHDVERIIEGYYRAENAADYADSIVLATEQISGEDYRMVWTRPAAETT